jgi:integrase
MATITKRGNSYRIKVSCGYGIDGKQIAQLKTWKPDPNMTATQIKKEVNKIAVLFEEECLKGNVVSTVKFQALAEEWFATYAKPNLRHTTYERYQQFTRRIYPAIGHLRIDRINTRTVQHFISSLSVDGVNQTSGKSLAPKTVRLYQGLISNIFNYAVRMGIVTDNPCSRVTLPKLDHKEKPIYTLEQTEKFLQLLEDEPFIFRLFFNLAIYSGFRRGELLGIEYKDIDWENGVIHICRTSNYTPKRGTFTDTTKTTRSKRSMKFPSHIMEMLKAFRIEQNHEREQMGNLWEEHDRVFAGLTGRPLTTSLPYKWLGKFCEKHGLPCYGVHHYRHLFASLLFKEGVDIVSVSGALGHTNPNVTLGVYSHMFHDTNDKITSAVTNALNFRKDQ